MTLSIKWEHLGSCIAMIVKSNLNGVKLKTCNREILQMFTKKDTCL